MWFSAEPNQDGTIRMVDETEWHFTNEAQMLWQLPGAINYLVSHSNDKLVIHAGAVKTPTGRVIGITGVPGTGKSTLVAALIRAGCDYIGDESVGITAVDLAAHAYPKPLTLDTVSQQLVGLAQPGTPGTPSEHRRAHEIRPDTACLAGPVGAFDVIVHTRYRPDEMAEAHLLDHGEALQTLLANTLNLARSANHGLAALCGLAETVPIVQVTHANSVELARRIVATDGDPRALTTT